MKAVTVVAAKSTLCIPIFKLLVSITRALEAIYTGVCPPLLRYSSPISNFSPSSFWLFFFFGQGHFVMPDVLLNMTLDLDNRLSKALLSLWLVRDVR